ncbi:MAG: CbiX/SirB N-terminal domain-containing protein [Solirubrobacterales bacterium]
MRAPAAGPPETGSTRLREVPPGAVARVVELDDSISPWRERLQAYGLVPGRELTVVQQAPVTVVRVEHIDLAFEPRISRGIIVSAGAVEVDRARCPGSEAPEAAADGRDEIARASSLGSGDDGGRIGVLLVNHGSRSPTWRRMLLDVHAEVAAELLAIPGVAQVRTAFMEYTEPSIATQLRAFDESGIESVVLVPLLLTISDHSFDDIPTICGLSADPDRVAQLKKDRVEIYDAGADLSFTPLLDFSGLVQANLARRIGSILGAQAEQEARGLRHGLVLIGYGSAEFDDEWNRFFAEIRAFAESELGISASAHAWCGHIVRYNRQPGIEAIDAMLDRADRAIVVPILVAYDPMFQERIIGGAVARCAAPERVLYGRDSILPEPEVGRWVIEIARRTIEGAAKERRLRPG